MNFSIISYNVNGIRAAIRKGFVDFLKEGNFDIVLLQETKANKKQVDMTEIEALGYEHYWFSAEKKGYSGVAILTKITPAHIEYGCGIEEYDKEGRIIRADFGDFSVISAYFPSGSSGDVRQEVKMHFLDDVYDYFTKLNKKFPKLLVSGDYNICHRAIDIHNPKTNKNTSGFLPEERDWMEKWFTQGGFNDTFRIFYPEDAHHYSWWSYRANARANNKGWRIDYHAASSDLKPHITNANIIPDAVHSDHCPIWVEIKI